MTEEKDPISGLVRRAQGGDREAFGDLFDLHRPRLVDFIRSRLGEGLRGRVGVDDLCQETFLKALRSIGEFAPRGEDSLFRWLAGIAGNLILDAAKRARRGPSPLPEEEMAAEGLSPSKALRREERFDRLRDALERLPPEYRQVIRLARIEKVPLCEVAAILGRTPEAARKLLWRALRSLKEGFGDTESLHLPPRSLDDPARGGRDGR